MKKIDFKQYNEKLKINSLSLSEFDKINVPSIVFDKNKLSNYDIMKTVSGNYYMLMFLGLDRKFEFNTYLDKMYKMLYKHNIDMFIRINLDNNAVYLTLDGYNDLGTRPSNKEFTIEYIWKAPLNIKFDKNDVFDIQGFENVITKYDYRIIYYNEDIQY